MSNTLVNKEAAEATLRTYLTAVIDRAFSKRDIDEGQRDTLVVALNETLEQLRIQPLAISLDAVLTLFKSKVKQKLGPKSSDVLRHIDSSNRELMEERNRRKAEKLQQQQQQQQLHQPSSSHPMTAHASNVPAYAQHQQPYPAPNSQASSHAQAYHKNNNSNNNMTGVHPSYHPNTMHPSQPPPRHMVGHASMQPNPRAHMPPLQGFHPNQPQYPPASQPPQPAQGHPAPHPSVPRPSHPSYSSYMSGPPLLPQPHPLPPQSNSNNLNKTTSFPSPAPAVAPRPPGSAPTPPTPTPADEIQAMTEKPNLQAEGIHMTERGVSGPVLDLDALSVEEQQSKSILRGTVGIPTAVMSPGLSPDWAFFNVLDRTMMQQALETISSKEKKRLISSTAQRTLSDGLQLHIKTMLEASIVVNRKRHNVFSVDTYRGLHRLMYSKNGGEATNENLNNIALLWGPPVAEALRRDEEQAAQLYEEVLVREEGSLKEMMSEAEEERLKAIGAKRKGGASSGQAESDAQWWQCDEKAEKKGLFTWEQLAESSFRADVANKYHLGPGAIRKKARKDDGPVTQHDPIASYRPNALARSEASSSAQDPLTKGQMQRCPIPLDSRNNIITYTDVLTAFNRSSQKGLNFTRDWTSSDPIAKYFAKWKVQA